MPTIGWDQNTTKCETCVYIWIILYKSLWIVWFSIILADYVYKIKYKSVSLARSISAVPIFFNSRCNSCSVIAYIRTCKCFIDIKLDMTDFYILFWNSILWYKCIYSVIWYIWPRTVEQIHKNEICWQSYKAENDIPCRQKVLSGGWKMEQPKAESIIHRHNVSFGTYKKIGQWNI